MSDPAVASLTASEETHLLQLAAEAKRRAYVPFSGFPVGAAVLTAAGGYFAGCNIENSSFGLTVCAERVAIFSAVSAEGPEMRLRAVAVTCGEPCVPCGACLQVIAEFGPDAVVYLNGPGKIQSTPLASLLPRPFRWNASRPRTDPR